jgi:EAL domain-containing protein (putative c-di-GMP-specific phosphodiesterase class I)
MVAAALDQDRSLLRQRSRGVGRLVGHRAGVNIANARNMTTTAEGVETEQQKDLLCALSGTEMQGYLYSPAKPAEEIRRLYLSRCDSAGTVARSVAVSAAI